MTTITPTVGRKVWYYANATQAEPIDATVVKVNNGEETATPETSVNLFLLHPDGSIGFRPDVVVSDEPTDREHFRWMPYQQQQASKESTVPAAGTKL